MARPPRQHIPDCLVHVIVRFVNEDFLMEDDECRSDYLRRLDEALRWSDWRLVAFCLMSSHIHLVFVTGRMPLDDWAKPVHSGFAGFINARSRASGGSRRGPVVAERPSTFFLPIQRAPYLIAYVHNNPVRARVVSSAELSTWSSHRAIVGLEPAPACLHVADALALCGYDDTDSDRTRFHLDVVARSGDPRDPQMSQDSLAARRREVRRGAGSGVEVCSPIVDEDRMLALHVPAAPRAFERLGYDGSAEDVLRAVTDVTGVSIEQLRARTRGKREVNGRRIAVLAWRRLDRPMSEMAGALGLSRAATSSIARSESAHAAHQSDAEVVVRVALDRELELD